MDLVDRGRGRGEREVLQRARDREDACELPSDDLPVRDVQCSDVRTARRE